MTEVKAKFPYPPNGQRNDIPMHWNGIDISGGAMCQGNSNENNIISIIKEFNVKNLSIPDTWHYYNLIIPHMQAILGNVKRKDVMDFRNHAKAMTLLFKSYNIPVIAKPWSSIGDSECSIFDGKAEFIHHAIDRTGRGLSLGGMWTEEGHWRSYHYSDELFMILKGNDSWGNPPYKTKAEKTTFTVKETWKEAETATLRRAITFEDK